MKVGFGAKLLAYLRPVMSRLSPQSTLYVTGSLLGLLARMVHVPRSFALSCAGPEKEWIVATFAVGTGGVWGMGRGGS